MNVAVTGSGVAIESAHLVGVPGWLIIRDRDHLPCVSVSSLQLNEYPQYWIKLAASEKSGRDVESENKIPPDQQK